MGVWRGEECGGGLLITTISEMYFDDLFLHSLLIVIQIAGDTTHDYLCVSFDKKSTLPSTWQRKVGYYVVS